MSAGSSDSTAADRNFAVAKKGRRRKIDDCFLTSFSFEGVDPRDSAGPVIQVIWRLTFVLAGVVRTSHEESRDIRIL